MNKLNTNSNLGVTLIKHYIKDLSFENLQSIKKNNSYNISESSNFIYEPFENEFFSVTFKYSCECLSKSDAKKLFLLELDYFGFFKIVGNVSVNQAELTKKGAKLIFPFVKSIIEDLSAKGGSIPLTLKDIDFNLVKV